MIEVFRDVGSQPCWQGHVYTHTCNGQEEHAGRDAAPLALRILRILLLVMSFTCATPCESLRMTPGREGGRRGVR